MLKGRVQDQFNRSTEASVNGTLSESGRALGLVGSIRRLHQQQELEEHRIGSMELVG